MQQQPISLTVGHIVSALVVRGIDSHDLDELVQELGQAGVARPDDDVAVVRAAEYAEAVNAGGLAHQVEYLMSVHEGRGDDVCLALSNFLALPPVAK